ncbi:hypothetical protein [Deinococcus soli (ex Cha et al. 2016)]|uniref:Uncharacterized protein n=2 Tax=Deinococcus soli (ex Cha et al. 2016) TaxID=1309411 RepID=A0ACC6KGK0_9DEIO|nr:hypothetical protein [Deinococcus soli (ex Cha et al. 2016)]MDR6218533.1 hypothetical protein [Deinococcus soli (ex Cha et al. 2016)]MDR6329273.1 hypothetical protein [Deinococcus soli (ex Cha et al. 2016)]MDR6751546.1 hypothetical protein [Deinococcus soli (ex Cha et al. 2016)]
MGRMTQRVTRALLGAVRSERPAARDWNAPVFVAGGHEDGVDERIVVASVAAVLAR